MAGPEVAVLEMQHEPNGDAIALTQAQVVLGVGMGLGGPEHVPAVQALAAPWVLPSRPPVMWCTPGGSRTTSRWASAGGPLRPSCTWLWASVAPSTTPSGS